MQTLCEHPNKAKVSYSWAKRSVWCLCGVALVNVELRESILLNYLQLHVNIPSFSNSDCLEKKPLRWNVSFSRVLYETNARRVASELTYEKPHKYWPSTQFHPGFSREHCPLDAPRRFAAAHSSCSMTSQPNKCLPCLHNLERGFHGSIATTWMRRWTTFHGQPLKRKASALSISRSLAWKPHRSTNGRSFL